ncbi:MAG: transporter substrate-binding domain-containing protein [Pseudomonadota bacterium]
MRNVLLVAVTIIAMMAQPIAAQASSRLTIGSGEYVPFTDSSAVDGGIVNEMISQIATQAGMTAEFEFMPWKRALELTRSGRFDATSFWYYSEERESDFIHVGPVIQDRLVFFRRAGTPEPTWETLADLSDYTIGAVTGYTFTPEFWEMAEAGSINIEVAPSDETNMRKLLAGRIDLYPMSEVSGRLLLERIFTQAELDQITISEKPLVTTNGYLLISRAIEDADAVAQRLQSVVDTIEPVTN